LSYPANKQTDQQTSGGENSIPIKSSRGNGATTGPMPNA